MKKTRQKYGNRKVVYNGIEFDSVKEKDRYIVLKQAEATGLISELTLQPHWDALPAKKETYIKHLKTKDKECVRTLIQPIGYTADFSYIKDGKLGVEDVKPTPKLVSRDVPLRLKLMKYFHGIEVRLVYNANDSI